MIAVIHGWLSSLPGPYFALAGIAAPMVAAAGLALIVLSGRRAPNAAPAR